MHVAVRLGRFEEADAAVVSVTDKFGEAFLADFALHLATDAASAKSQPGDLYVGFAESDPVDGGLARRCGHRECSGDGDGTGCGGSGFEKFSTGVQRHRALLIGAGITG